jgi:hypothetical protein
MATIATRLNFTNIAAGTNPRSVNITLGAGTSRKLVVVAANETVNAATLDSATFDGTSITSFVNRTDSAMRRRWFYYDIPDGKGDGTYAIAVTLSSDTGAISVAAWITNSDTAGVPEVSTTILAASDASGAGSIATVSGDALFTAYFDQTGGQTASAASSQVTLGNSQNISTSGFRAHKYDAIGDATETVTVTWTPNTTSGAKVFDLVNSTPAVVGPTITVQPVADTVILTNENTATFSVTATGAGGLTYDWELEDGVGSGVYANLANGNGATWTGQAASSCTATLTAKTLSGRRVRCNVTDDNGTTTTNAVALTIFDGPQLTTFPATDDDGESTATLTCDYVTGVGEAIEVRIPLSDGDVAVTVTTT